MLLGTIEHKHLTTYIHLNRQDSKMDQMLDKQNRTVSEIRALSPNMHDLVGNRFQKTEGEISKINAKMGSMQVQPCLTAPHVSFNFVFFPSTSYRIVPAK